MSGSAERRKVRLIIVKLFSKNSNPCDHNTPTLQTDGQMDRQLNGNSALRYASRGKNQ